MTDKKQEDNTNNEEQPVVEDTAETNEREEESQETVGDAQLSKTTSNTQIPEFHVGDTIKIFYKIIEGDKTRIQPYEGIVISYKGSGESKTFTVRRIGADNIGVERIFPLHSPNITKINLVKRGKVRKAKLYYLRGKKGKERMRIKEKVSE